MFRNDIDLCEVVQEEYPIIKEELSVVKWREKCLEDYFKEQINEPIKTPCEIVDSFRDGRNPDSAALAKRAYAKIVLTKKVEAFLKARPERCYKIEDVVKEGEEDGSLKNITQWKRALCNFFSAYVEERLGERNNIVCVIYSDGHTHTYKYSERCSEALSKRFTDKKGICYQNDCRESKISHCPFIEEKIKNIVVVGEL